MTTLNAAAPVEAQAVEAQADDAARSPVKPPEGGAGVAPALVPPETPTVLTVPVQQTTEQAIVTGANAAPLVVMPPDLQKAEKNLAPFIAGKINPQLTSGLMLTLVSALGKNSTTDVKLVLTGPLVDSNAALLGKEVLAALAGVSAIAPLFHGPHKPHAQKPEGLANTLEIHMPQLTDAQYATLIHSLAAGITPASPSIFSSQQPSVAAPATAQLDAAPQADVAAASQASVAAAALAETAPTGLPTAALAAVAPAGVAAANDALAVEASAAAAPAALAATAEAPKGVDASAAPAALTDQPLGETAPALPSVSIEAPGVHRGLAANAPTVALTAS
ncbi:MAG: hypothetical protein V4735_01610 [Pseudomonadota bacterium]